MWGKQLFATIATFLTFSLVFNQVGIGPLKFANAEDLPQNTTNSSSEVLPNSTATGNSDDNANTQNQNSSEGSTPLPPSPTVDTEQFSSQAKKRMEFLEQVKRELSTTQQDYHVINSNVKDTESKLNEVKKQTFTLESQLKNLDEQIRNSELIIQNLVAQITEKENTLKALAHELAIKNLEIQNQKEMLMEYLKVLYSQENSIYNTTNDQATVNIAKLLLSDKPIGETLQELKYFKILESNGREILVRLETLAKEQTISQRKTESIQKTLTKQYQDLAEEQENLKVQRKAKEELLVQTKGQEKIYQQLLEESKLEQAQTLQDIGALRANLAFIQEQIAAKGDKFNPDDYKGLLNKETTSVYDYIRSTEGQNEFFPSWPVTPSRGVSAYFHDESYRVAMGVPHNAIDIRVPQGTPIRAPADGVVYKAKDNGYGYSYIILAHGGGFMTLYGHVFEIRVIEGEKIKQGQVIGLSGATPGTKGAGLMTTGPHLHFEVFKGGKHVDPLDYLSLSYLPLSTLPAKYLNRVTGEPPKVKRVAE